MQSLSRIAEILDIVSAHESGVQLVDLTRECDISKTALQRITNDMCDEGMLLKADSEKFFIGPRFFYWMGKYQTSFILLKIARPIIEEVHRHTSETIHLFQYRDGEAFYVDKIESVHPLTIRSAVGTSQPLYCTGGGKAILGAMSAKNLARYLENQKLEKRAANTITSANQLQKALAEGRKKGFYEEIEENEQGIRCIGVPIMDAKNEPIGAVSITVPIIRAPSEKQLIEWGNYLKKKVEELESALWQRGRHVE